MKMLTEAEYNALLAARAERDEYVKARGERDVGMMARELVAEAIRRGLVLTIEQRPLQPLAMGHYQTIVMVRPSRQRT